MPRARPSAASTTDSGGSASTWSYTSTARPRRGKPGRIASSKPSRVIPGSVTINTRRALRSRQSSARRMAEPASQRICAVVAKLKACISVSLGETPVRTRNAPRAGPSGSRRRRARLRGACSPAAGCAAGRNRRCAAWPDRNRPRRSRRPALPGLVPRLATRGPRAIRRRCTGRKSTEVAPISWGSRAQASSTWPVSCRHSSRRCSTGSASGASAARPCSASLATASSPCSASSSPPWSPSSLRRTRSSAWMPLVPSYIWVMRLSRINCSMPHSRMKP